MYTGTRCNTGSRPPALPVPGRTRRFRSHGLLYRAERASSSGPPLAALDGRADARVLGHLGLARVRAGSAAGVEGEGDRQRGKARPRKGRAGVRGGGQRRDRQRTARRVTACAGRIAVGEQTPPASAAARGGDRGSGGVLKAWSPCAHRDQTRREKMPDSKVTSPLGRRCRREPAPGAVGRPEALCGVLGRPRGGAPTCRGGGRACAAHDRPISPCRSSSPPPPLASTRARAGEPRLQHSRTPASAAQASRSCGLRRARRSPRGRGRRVHPSECPGRPSGASGAPESTSPSARFMRFRATACAKDRMER